MLTMNKDRLKLIVKNLKLLVQSLEAEIYSDPQSYTSKISSDKPYSISDDDDGYPD
jgi:hypothetical protein